MGFQGVRFKLKRIKSTKAKINRAKGFFIILRCFRFEAAIGVVPSLPIGDQWPNGKLICDLIESSGVEPVFIKDAFSIIYWKISFEFIIDLPKWFTKFHDKMPNTWASF